MNELLLLSRNDIPFPELGISLHNPIINEIGLINEDKFHYGVMFLNFSANKFIDKDKSGLNDKSDFDLFMKIINDKSQKQYKVYVSFVLSLIFPTCQIQVVDDKILLQKMIFKQV